MWHALPDQYLVLNEISLCTILHLLCGKNRLEPTFSSSLTYQLTMQDKQGTVLDKDSTNNSVAPFSAFTLSTESALALFMSRVTTHTLEHFREVFTFFLRTTTAQRQWGTRQLCRPIRSHTSSTHNIPHQSLAREEPDSFKPFKPPHQIFQQHTTNTRPGPSHPSHKDSFPT